MGRMQRRLATQLQLPWKLVQKAKQVRSQKYKLRPVQIIRLQMRRIIKEQ
jgi:hypothetical protein